jgi:hypothetical protein
MSSSEPAASDTQQSERDLPLRAFASYSWAATEDVTTIGDLVAELRMRAFTTFRDRDSLEASANLEADIRQQLTVSDAVMPYLTPVALASDLVVELEFRSAAALQRGHGRPRLVPIMRNLGSTHAEVTANTYDRLRYDFQARWTGQIAPPGDGPLPRELIARYAADALRAVLPPGEGPDDGRWRLMLATRGDRPAPWPLTVDATELLGGNVPRSGDPNTWGRLFRALCELKAVLTAHGDRREIDICAASHLTAAVAAGYVFRSSTGWRIGALTADGIVCRRSPSGVEHELEFTSEYGAYSAKGGVLAVDIDLVPRHIEPAVSDALSEPPRARLSIRRSGASTHMDPHEFGAAAGAIAARVKQLRGEVRASRVELFLAAPGPFALLLGAELGAVGCTVRLHEHHDDKYLPSLDLPG